MNPKNTNDTGQNIAKLNLSQNTMDQNMAFPAQDLQQAQDPFAQNLPLQTPPPKLKKPILIACIVSVLVLTIATIGIVYIIEEVGSDAASDVVGMADVAKFKQMTKVEAVAFLQAGQQNVAGNMPKNYVGEEITDLLIVENNVVKSDVKLKYSHDTIDDLRQIAEEWYGVLGHNNGITKDDYEIKEYDYYAIVTPNRIEGEGSSVCDYDYYGDCNSLLSFKSDYINYYQEQTTSNSYNSVAYLQTQNSELVERLLRVYSLFSNYGVASLHGNIYDSSFEEQDDMFVLTVYYIGVGLNMENLKADGGDMGYAINLYSQQYAADKVDGRLHVIRTEENSAIKNIKSIPITQEEAASLLSM